MLLHHPQSVRGKLFLFTSEESIEQKRPIASDSAERKISIHGHTREICSGSLTQLLNGSLRHNKMLTHHS